MSQSVEFSLKLSLLGAVFHITCKGKYTPGSPGIHTLPNGDPGYPPEPGELDLTSAEVYKINDTFIPTLVLDPSAFYDEYTDDIEEALSSSL